MSIVEELASALMNLLYQTEQMQGLFDDEDGNIQDAIDQAYEAIETYKKMK